MNCLERIECRTKRTSNFYFLYVRDRSVIIWFFIVLFTKYGNIYFKCCFNNLAPTTRNVYTTLR